MSDERDDSLLIGILIVLVLLVVGGIGLGGFMYVRVVRAHEMAARSAEMAAVAARQAALAAEAEARANAAKARSQETEALRHSDESNSSPSAEPQPHNRASDPERPPVP